MIPPNTLPDLNPKQGLRTEMNELNEKLDLLMGSRGFKKKIKDKTFPLPFSMKSQLKTLAKKNKVQVLLLQTSRNIKPITAEVQEGMLIIGEKFVDGSTDGLWIWNGKHSTFIVPEWDLKPLTPARIKGITDITQTHISPQTIIIRAIELKETLMPKKMSGKIIIWILIAGVAIFYVLFGGGLTGGG